jgi:hypothetical protein
MAHDLGAAGGEHPTAERWEGIHMQPRDDTTHQPGKVGAVVALWSMVVMGRGRLTGGLRRSGDGNWRGGQRLLRWGLANRRREIHGGTTMSCGGSGEGPTMTAAS